MAGSTCIQCSDNFIVNNKYVPCDLCEQKYHIQCVRIKDNVSKLLSECDNFKWFCDKCLTTVHQKLRSDKDNISANNNLQLAVKENECLLREIDLLKKVVSDQTYIVDLQKQKLQELTEKTVSAPSSSANISTIPVSFSDAIKKKYKQSDEESPVLFIKSNENISSADVSKEIKSNINPASLNINIKTTKYIKNGLAVTCENKTSLEKLKSNITNKVGNKFSVSETRKRNPRLMVRGVEKEIAGSDELITDLVSQNNLQCAAGDIKVITKLTNEHYTNVVIEVVPSVRNQILKNNGVFIGWRRCAVADHIKVTRCFKCSRYNHIKEVCKAETTCPKCSGSHELKVCTSESEKCINCVTFNLHHKTNIPINHSVTSPTCHIYKQKVDTLINTINYND